MIAKELISKDYVEVDQNDTISKLIGALKRKNEKSAVILDKKKYIGVINKRLLIKTKLDPSKMKVKKIIEKVPVLKGDEDVPKIAKLMYTADTHILPIVEKGMVEGVVKLIDLLDLIKENKKLSRIKASQVMGTKKLITVKETDRLGKAIEIMKEAKVNRIPVVDEKRELVNIVSVADFMFNYLLHQQGRAETGIGRRKVKSKGFGQRIDFNAFPIKAIASIRRVNATPDSTVSRIIDLMKEFNISSIVLVEDKKPVGIVAKRDLLKLLIKAVTF
ncbi:CBS domain-containing protein [Candidatus Woesearchaeota archaeon]|nr:CBS domain-containing protein [Candidatus Woesearchaeota archaeon]